MHRADADSISGKRSPSRLTKTVSVRFNRAGRHRVVFRYQAPGLKIGAIFSLGTLMLLGLGTLRARKPPQEQA